MAFLSQKADIYLVRGTSPLLPKADICRTSCHVRFVPIADIHVCSVRPLRHFLNVAVRTTGRQLRSKTDSQRRQPRQLTLHRSCERPAH